MIDNLITRFTFIFNFSSRQKSKHQIFHEQICRSFKIGEIVKTKKLSWEDALSYAEDKDEHIMFINGMISFNLLLNEKELYVLFTPTHCGGIYISAYDRNIKFRSGKHSYVS